ncbi:MAG: hypothetical protein KC587_13455 [Nitrospira sp.]|nr:hypothetical protein [Nitrospira sp.]MCA9457666.1 hypothetical protein [Nitrospira sp.]MCW5783816.1 hypothetical protein [Nitrospirales bacterium]
MYNKARYFEKSQYDKYVINSQKAKANEDESVPIHCGGAPKSVNHLPITVG